VIFAGPQNPNFDVPPRWNQRFLSTLDSDLDVSIFTRRVTPIGAATYVRQGETRAIDLSLEPGKYFVEIATNEGYGTA
jgi:hypothetical protein